MSEPTVHKMPNRMGPDGIVIDQTPCCGESGAGLVLTPDWERVTCVCRLDRNAPRPPCPRCGGETFLISDSALCEPQGWIIGHDCLPCG